MSLSLYSLEDHVCIITAVTNPTSNSYRKTWVCMPGTDPADIFQAYFDNYGFYPQMIDGMALPEHVWEMTEEYYRNTYPILGE